MMRTRCRASTASHRKHLLGMLAILTLSLTNGCSLMRGRSAADVSPPRSQLPIEIHADFPLPDDHSLRNDLLVLRRQILGDLQLQPNSPPIQVHIFSTMDRYRQFMNRHFPSFPDRRAYFVEDEGKLTVYAPWSDKLSVDLRHELTHAYLHSATAEIPLWLDEGLAEYYEVPSAERGLNRLHMDTLVREAQGGRWSPNLPRLEQMIQVEEMSQRDYAESWCWVHWLMSDTGDQIGLLQAYLAGPCSRPCPEPFSLALQGKDPDAQVQIQDHLARLRKLH